MNHLFKSTYCFACKQIKTCSLLHPEFCCSCYYQRQKETAQEYSDYEKIFTSKKQEQKTRFQQLQLLKNYSGCKTCGSLEIDAYSLYQENKLICQPCLMRKEKGACGPISFTEQSKWYKKYWQINLSEWLANFSQLPVNANCARQWLKDKNHLNNCHCLESEAKEIYLLFTNSLKIIKAQLKECKCRASLKPRITYTDNHGNGWTYCEICQQIIDSAGHHGVIRNRNDPKFWGVHIPQKVLCLTCLKFFCKEMPVSKKYVFNKYLRRGYN